MDSAQPGTQEASDGLPGKARYWAVTAIWLALLMAVIDSSIANVALPTIARDLHAAAVESIWIVNAYQLAIVISLLPLAAFGEIVTFRRVFLAGLALFVLASIACCFARSVPELAVCRAIQGFGAAGVMSVNGALVRHIFPSAQLGRGVGLNALVISIASVIGPSLASAILAATTWPWLFAVNVPTGLAALAVGFYSLPENPKSGGRLDRISTLLNIAAYGLIIVGLDLLTRGGARGLGFAGIAAGILAGWLLVRRSLPQARPLIPIDLLRSRLFSLTIATSIASFTAQMLAFVALPFFFQSVMHHSQVQTGLLMTAWPLAVGVAAPLACRLADRLPCRVAWWVRPGPAWRRPMAARRASGRGVNNGHSLAHGGLRLGLRVFPGAEQSNPAQLRAEIARRRRRRHARHGQTYRPDCRRRTRRHAIRAYPARAGIFTMAGRNCRRRRLRRQPVADDAQANGLKHCG